LRPIRAIYKEDLEGEQADGSWLRVEDYIHISTAKMILKQYLVERSGYEGEIRDNTWADKSISDALISFTEAVDKDTEVLLLKIEELEEDLKDAEEEDKKDLQKEILTIKDTLNCFGGKSIDTSNSLLWELNKLMGIGRRRNLYLRKKNYRDPKYLWKLISFLSP
jgi:hypothetical protein